MGLEGFGDLSIGLVACVLVLREVFAFLSKRESLAATDQGGDCDDARATLGQIDGKLDDLNAATQSMAAILTRTDPDGLPLCYTPRSLGKSVERLAESVDKLAARDRLG